MRKGQVEKDNIKKEEKNSHSHVDSNSKPFPCSARCNLSVSAVQDVTSWEGWVVQKGWWVVRRRWQVVRRRWWVVQGRDSPTLSHIICKRENAHRSDPSHHTPAMLCKLTSTYSDIQAHTQTHSDLNVKRSVTDRSRRGHGQDSYEKADLWCKMYQV